MEKNTMQTNKKITLFLIQPAIILVLSSCSIVREPVGVTPLPDLDQSHHGDAVAKRFEEPAPQDEATVESVMELSEKYAKLSEETVTLRLKNQNLIAENRQLKDQFTALDTQLEKTESELTEANNLLMEMLIELNNWKTDVIGFREEIRGAEKAQLEALFKILKVLGGEVKPELVQVEDTGPVAVSTAVPAQPQLQETQTIGEPNE
jgi:chromosome segregation ATPase